MTRRPTALERLLAVRRAEEASARAQVQLATATSAAASETLRVATVDRDAAATELEDYGRQWERRAGFTIVQMQVHADGVDALRSALHAAEVRRAAAQQGVRQAEETAARLTATYLQAQRAADVVQDRVDAARAGLVAAETRREEEDALDALMARDLANKGR